jgi:hypothetical protein
VYDLGTNGHGIQKLDGYEKSVLDLLSFESKQRKWLVAVMPKNYVKEKTAENPQQLGRRWKNQKSLPEHRWLTDGVVCFA